MQRYVEGLKPSAAVAMNKGCTVLLGTLPACLLSPHALKMLVVLGDAAQVSNRLVCTCELSPSCKAAECLYCEYFKYSFSHNCKSRECMSFADFAACFPMGLSSNRDLMNMVT